MVEEKHTGIFNDPLRLCNMDDTTVNAEYAKKKKVFSPAVSNHGGETLSCFYNWVRWGEAHNCCHRCLTLGTSSSSFFIVAGKRAMSNWFLPVSKTRYKFKNGSLLQSTKTGWMPSDVCVTISDKGLMDMELIKIFVQHLDRFVRKHLPGSLSYVILLDGHGSRGGVEWLNICQDKNVKLCRARQTLRISCNHVTNLLTKCSKRPFDPRGIRFVRRQ